MSEFLLTEDETDEAIHQGMLGWVKDTAAKAEPAEMVLAACNSVAKAQAKRLVEWLGEHNMLKAGSKARGLVLGAGDWQELQKLLE